MGWALLVLGFGLLVVWASPAADAHGDPAKLHYTTVDYAKCTTNNDRYHMSPQQEVECANLIAGGEVDGGGKIEKLIQTVTSILAWVAGVAAVIVIIVQGLRMILSGSDSNTISSTRSGIIYALAGLAVAVSAPHLVGYIVSRL